MHLETPLRQLHVTHSHGSRAIVIQTQGGTQNRARDLLKKGSAFLLSSNQWTVCLTGMFAAETERVTHGRPLISDALGSTMTWGVAWQTSNSAMVSAMVCSAHPPAPDRVYVGALSPACLVLRPCMVACARSCCAHVRPYTQGRCGRCPPGCCVMFDLLILLWSYDQMHLVRHSVRSGLRCCML